MSTVAAGGGGDSNGGGDPKGKNTNTTPDPKKMSTLERHASIYARKNCRCHCKRRGTSLEWSLYSHSHASLFATKNCRCHYKRRETSLWWSLCSGWSLLPFVAKS
jgi:hypothetical protein